MCCGFHPTVAHRCAHAAIASTADEPGGYICKPALADGRCVATTGFAMNQIVPDGRRGEFGDVVNFLAELADILPIGHDNYGEGIRLELRAIGLQAFISMEAAGGGCSYEVTALVV